MNSGSCVSVSCIEVVDESGTVTGKELKKLKKILLSI